jgi:hypothetical protein
MDLVRAAISSPTTAGCPIPAQTMRHAFARKEKKKKKERKKPFGRTMTTPMLWMVLLFALALVRWLRLADRRTDAKFSASSADSRNFSLGQT